MLQKITENYGIGIKGDGVGIYRVFSAKLSCGHRVELELNEALAMQRENKDQIDCQYCDLDQTNPER